MNLSRIALVLGALICVSGCVSSRLPASARFVGGGGHIEWASPDPGTIILIDSTTGKVVATKAVFGPGDSFTFDMTSQGDMDILRQALGGEPKKVELALYFIPTPR